MAGGRVCGAGAAVERSGAVWSDCVLGKPADAGDWSEDGAGSAAWVGVPDGFEGGELVDCGGGGGGGGLVDCGGCGGGAGVLNRGWDDDADVAVWCACVGRADAGGCGDCAGSIRAD